MKAQGLGERILDGYFGAKRDFNKEGNSTAKNALDAALIVSWFTGIVPLVVIGVAGVSQLFSKSRNMSPLFKETTTIDPPTEKTDRIYKKYMQNGEHITSLTLGNTRWEARDEGKELLGKFIDLGSFSQMKGPIQDQIIADFNLEKTLETLGGRNVFLSKLKSLNPESLKSVNIQQLKENLSTSPLKFVLMSDEELKELPLSSLKPLSKGQVEHLSSRLKNIPMTLSDSVPANLMSLTLSQLGLAAFSKEQVVRLVNELGYPAIDLLSKPQLETFISTLDIANMPKDLFNNLFTGKNTASNFELLSKAQQESALKRSPELLLTGMSSDQLRAFIQNMDLKTVDEGVYNRLFHHGVDYVSTSQDRFAHLSDSQVVDAVNRFKASAVSRMKPEQMEAFIKNMDVKTVDEEVYKRLFHHGEDYVSTSQGRFAYLSDSQVVDAVNRFKASAVSRMKPEQMRAFIKNMDVKTVDEGVYNRLFHHGEDYVSTSQDRFAHLSDSQVVDAVNRFKASAVSRMKPEQMQAFIKKMDVKTVDEGVYNRLFHHGEDYVSTSQGRFAYLSDSQVVDAVNRFKASAVSRMKPEQMRAFIKNMDVKTVDEGVYNRLFHHGEDYVSTSQDRFAHLSDSQVVDAVNRFKASAVSRMKPEQMRAFIKNMDVKTVDEKVYNRLFHHGEDYVSTSQDRFAHLSDSQVVDAVNRFKASAVSRMKPEQMRAFIKNMDVKTQDVAVLDRFFFDSSDSFSVKNDRFSWLSDTQVKDVIQVFGAVILQRMSPSQMKTYLQKVDVETMTQEVYNKLFKGSTEAQERIKLIPDNKRIQFEVKFGLFK
jgi:ubiquitin